MQITNVMPIYTGGGVYEFLGSIDNNTYFKACDDFFDVRIIDTDPIDNDNVGLPEWESEHLIKNLDEQEARIFFRSMIDWVLKNKPNGNYTMYEIEKILNKI